MLVAFLLSTMSTLAQVKTSSSPNSPNRNASEDTSKSRAEQAAEEMVSLSPEKIISILEQEPGLLLQVKKMLVRKAFEQGRILDPRELTDEALYRLVRSDENIRVIATREIEDREYIRVKPSKDELENDQQRRMANLYSGSSSQQTSGKTGRSQEDEYWQRRDYQNGVGGYGNGNRQMQTPGGGSQNPQNAPVDDPRRAVERAQAQSPNGDLSNLDSGGPTSTGLPLDVIAGMQGVSPDQLSALLQSRTGGKGGLSAASQLDPATLASLTGGATSGSGVSAPGGAVLPSFDQSQNDETQLPQQARLENPNRTTSLRQSPTNRRDQPQLRHSANPYADVPSLYDLYSQYSQRPPHVGKIRRRRLSQGNGQS